MMAVRSPASEEERTPSSDEAASKISCAKAATFPTKLYAMLQLADSIPEFARAVTWLPHGRAFSVLNKDDFMEDVVPVFFNQTKIRSFNRQLHLWGFRRIGKGKEQVWYHDNFLRGVPEYMDRMVRTKIKGDSSFFRGDVPHFDHMPPLPIGDKQLPSDVLNEMEEAILKLKKLSSSIVRSDSAAKPPNHNDNVTDHQSLMHDANHPTFSSRSEHHPSKFGVVNLNNPDEQFMPPPFSATSFNFFGSQGVPSMHPHPPIPSNSMAYASNSDQEVQSSPTLRVQEAGVCPFSPIKHGGDGEVNYEPLPFRVDNNSCHGDDFSNFIERTIRNVEEDGSKAAKRT